MRRVGWRVGRSVSAEHIPFFPLPSISSTDTMLGHRYPLVITAIHRFIAPLPMRHLPSRKEGIWTLPWPGIFVAANHIPNSMAHGPRRSGDCPDQLSRCDTGASSPPAAPFLHLLHEVAYPLLSCRSRRNEPEVTVSLELPLLTDGSASLLLLLLLRFMSASPPPE